MFPVCRCVEYLSSGFNNDLVTETKRASWKAVLGVDENAEKDILDMEAACQLDDTSSPWSADLAIAERALKALVERLCSYLNMISKGRYRGPVTVRLSIHNGLIDVLNARLDFMTPAIEAILPLLDAPTDFAQLLGYCEVGNLKDAPSVYVAPDCSYHEVFITHADRRRDRRPSPL
ncbi:hypothetical protein M011DRAFT_470497 [Sporormia fimetaria CBS 119925]|uniref:Uncharacterized protein n=1 Tax=Sporormia fimetaria CBS 119925 TaxID=1340428 RepID=A0A6A6V1G1_9PLEO|nr:hypothetical protein M011DRAFT_470497 [Sporormia fimetaria CBS 119925]